MKAKIEHLFWTIYNRTNKEMRDEEEMRGNNTQVVEIQQEYYFGTIPQ
jgi:hypothetical protein